jgi:hypothetical protein
MKQHTLKWHAARLIIGEAMLPQQGRREAMWKSHISPAQAMHE